MELSTATTLIRKGVPDNGRPQRWADLGAGSGVFTKALAACLPDRSTIIAVDRNQQVSISHTINDVFVEQQVSDFVRNDIPDNLDGILMANALHFVNDKDLFFRKLERSLNREGTLIIVEYDLDKANPWIPFPISYRKLSSDFPELFAAVESIGHADSLYQRAGMYSARLTFRKGDEKV